MRLLEFQRPTLASQPVFWVILPLTVALAAFRARERPALLAATVLFGALAIRAVRMTYEFEIVAAPTLAWGLGVLQRRHSARFAALVASLFFVVCLASRRADRWPLTMRLSPQWNESLVPVRVAKFVQEEKLSGPHFNSFSDGGYLEYAVPELPAFLDARVQAYPAELLRELQEAERTRAGFDRFLRAHGVEWAITTRIRERLGGFRLLDQPGWALVYWDEIEYRYFRPYGSIVAGIAHVPQEDLPRLWRELDRYERTSPNDPFALIVRCGAARRLALEGAEVVCAAASVRAPTADTRALAAKAAALRP